MESNIDIMREYIKLLCNEYSVKYIDTICETGADDCDILYTVKIGTNVYSIGGMGNRTIQILYNDDVVYMVNFDVCKAAFIGLDVVFNDLYNLIRHDIVTKVGE
jgi:hypothetical protein